MLAWVYNRIPGVRVKIRPIWQIVLLYYQVFLL